MDTLTINFFTYGRVFLQDPEDPDSEVLLKFCSSNPSFLEVTRTSDCALVRWLSVFQIRNVRPVGGGRFKIRMRDYAQSAYLTCRRERELPEVLQQFQNLVDFAQSVPYAEFSLRNLVRLCLYATGLANPDNLYTRDDVDRLLHALHVFLDPGERHRLLRRCVEDRHKVTNKDLRAVFEVLVAKPELLGIFRSLLGLPDGAPVAGRRLPLSAFYAYLAADDEPYFSLATLANFVAQVTNTNVLLPPEAPVAGDPAADGPDPAAPPGVDFLTFCLFHFSNLNGADDMRKLRENAIYDLPLTACFVASAFDPHIKLGSLDEITSLEGVEQALESNCRHLSLSVSDGPDGRPVLTTSVTNPSPILAETALKFLADLIFRRTDAPFILALEVYCRRTQRDVLAELLAATFFGAIYQVPPSAFQLSSLPPIKMLRNKVLLQMAVKYPSFSADDSTGFRMFPREPLECLVSLFEEPFQELKLRSVYGLFRLPHARVAGLLRRPEDRLRLREFTQRHLLAVHPDARSFFNPDTALLREAGVQFWLIDPRVRDDQKFAQRCLFQRNNGCGIVAKPAHLMAESGGSDAPGEDGPGSLRSVLSQGTVGTVGGGTQDGQGVPALPAGLPSAPVLTLTVSVVSSQILDFSDAHAGHILYPFVQVQLTGHPADAAANRACRTAIAQNNLFHCVFHSPRFHFRVAHPDAAFLDFLVVDAQSEKVLRRGRLAPLYLKRGLRTVRLYDPESNFDGFSFLLVYLSF